MDKVEERMIITSDDGIWKRDGVLIFVMQRSDKRWTRME